MLQGHSDDVDANDEGDDEVQVVVCAQCMDHQAHVAIAGIVGQPLSFCGDKIHSKTLHLSTKLHHIVFCFHLYTLQ